MKSERRKLQGEKWEETFWITFDMLLSCRCPLQRLITSCLSNSCFPHSKAFFLQTSVSSIVEPPASIFDKITFSRQCVCYKFRWLCLHFIVVFLFVCLFFQGWLGLGSFLEEATGHWCTSPRESKAHFVMEVGALKMGGVLSHRNWCGQSDTAAV